MSGSPKNIQRDCIWVELKTADELTFGNPSNINAATYIANAKSAVHSDKANAFTRAMVTMAIDQIELIGVYLEPPDQDNTPYRVFADLVINAQSGTIDNACVVVGYGPATPTGVNDVIDEPYILPFNQNRFDDCIMVPPLLSTDPNYGRPLFFGVGPLASNAIAGLFTVAHISVQRLAVSAPQMIYSVA